MEIDRIALYDVLSVRLGDSDFQQIVFRLRLRYDNLAGNTLKDKIRSLIEQLEDRQQLPELVTAVRTVRPDIEELVEPYEARQARQRTQYEIWQLDLDDLVRELPRRLGSHLVGLGISFDDINFENGCDRVLQNFCLRARNEYKWTTPDPPIRTLHPLAEQKTRQEILREVRKLQTGYTFYNLKVKFTEQTKANAFWQELQSAFDDEFQRIFGTTRTYSMIVLMARGPQTVFPEAVSYLGQFEIQRDQVFQWVFRVVNDMAQRVSLHDWPPDISHEWADLAIRDSSINGSISLYDLFDFLSESVRLLSECQTGQDFLRTLRDWRG